ncbi:Cytochrome P450 4V2 [Aphelenchoides besseyi]|nr:Cytochrome P450 4V2 [Aphelenchoides besseyi]KAI6237790.1 Cytochrome P450 4V2 [Aphelenchoides besseyi]
MGVVGVLVVVFLITLFVMWLSKMYERNHKLLNGIQGPTPQPVIGNVHQFRFRPDEFFEQAQGLAYMFRGSNERIVSVWLGPQPFVMIYGAKECEAILGGQKTLTKMFHYNFLSPWIGDGLLISKPKKWRPRRKLLTPTFHYDILKDFVQVYNRHAKTLLGKFDKLVGQGYNDIFHMITLCTLDVICESALGYNIDAQNKQTDYLESVFRMKYIIHQRQVKPFLYPEFMFNLFGHGREQKKHVKILHDFTSKAILARKKAVDEAGGVQKLLEKERISGHSRMAFLDLMLDMMDKGELDLEGIQEEVDTFTFEGHDTTSAAMNWFLHLMGNNPDIQAKVQREVDEVLGDSQRDVSFEDIGRFRYLEACFKETLRLYPSVPLFARQMVENTQIHNHIVPAGTGVVIVPSMVHRDERYWENPEKFDPERFIDKELKHPYCYIPFSAGSRNCIGQRFAMMEEKCIIAQIMRDFKVKAKLRTDQMRVAAELIIRPLYGNEIQFERRSFGDYTPISD